MVWFCSTKFCLEILLHGSQSTWTPSHLKLTMMAPIQTTLLVLLLNFCVVQSQSSSQCSDSQLQAYQKCVQDNACLCSTCDPNPLDEYPTIHLDQPPQSCQDVNRIFCPLIKCCSVCEDVAQQWYTCAFNDFSASQLGTECPQVCSAFAVGDVEGDCQPTAATLAPTSIPTAAESFPTSAAPTESPTTAPVASTLSPSAAEDETQTSSLHAGVSAAGSIAGSLVSSFLTSGVLLLVACLI